VTGRAAIELDTLTIRVPIRLQRCRAGEMTGSVGSCFRHVASPPIGERQAGRTAAELILRVLCRSGCEPVHTRVPICVRATRRGAVRPVSGMAARSISTRFRAPVGHLVVDEVVAGAGSCR
jgi:hypothetical protein